MKLNPDDTTEKNLTDGQEYTEQLGQSADCQMNCQKVSIKFLFMLCVLGVIVSIPSAISYFAVALYLSNNEDDTIPLTLMISGGVLMSIVAVASSCGTYATYNYKVDDYTDVQTDQPLGDNNSNSGIELLEL